MNVLLSLVLLVAPVKLGQVHFNIVKDGKKIGTEEFSIAKKESIYTIVGTTTIGNLTTTSRMQLDEKLVPISYEASSGQGTIRVKIEKPVSELETEVNGQSSTADFRFPEGGVILDNNFFHHYVMLMYRVHSGETKFEVFVPQDMSIGTATVRPTGPRAYSLEVGDIKLQATTDAEGSLLKLTVPGAGVVVEQ